jgi:hypothetical protein
MIQMQELIAKSLRGFKEGSIVNGRILVDVLYAARRVRKSPGSSFAKWIMGHLAAKLATTTAQPNKRSEGEISSQ